MQARSHSKRKELYAPGIVGVPASAVRDSRGSDAVGGGGAAGCYCPRCYPPTAGPQVGYPRPSSSFSSYAAAVAGRPSASAPSDHPSSRIPWLPSIPPLAAPHAPEAAPSSSAVDSSSIFIPLQTLHYYDPSSVTPLLTHLNDLTALLAKKEAQLEEARRDNERLAGQLEAAEEEKELLRGLLASRKRADGPMGGARPETVPEEAEDAAGKEDKEEAPPPVASKAARRAAAIRGGVQDSLKAFRVKELEGQVRRLERELEALRGKGRGGKGATTAV
ncbi:hypothetical protein JCM10213v2_006452 [Rhodosporidiobolus nylandii]